MTELHHCLKKINTTFDEFKSTRFVKIIYSVDIKYKIIVNLLFLNLFDVINNFIHARIILLDVDVNKCILLELSDDNNIFNSI